MRRSSSPIVALALILISVSAALSLVDGAGRAVAQDATEVGGADEGEWRDAAAAAASAAADGFERNGTTRGGNSTRLTDGGTDQSDCFYFCPTWTNVFVVCLTLLLLACLCGAITQHQPREIWYVVDRAAGEPPALPPIMVPPPPPPSHQQRQQQQQQQQQQPQRQQQQQLLQ